MLPNIQDPGRQSLDIAAKLLAAQKVSAAVREFNTAEACGADPDTCGSGRWQALMLEGNFQSAWAESRAILQRGNRDPHRLWQGESLNGKHVIVRCLHGLGDTVQMLRFAPRLHSIASQLTFEVAPAFMPLAPLFLGVSDVITWKSQAPATPPSWDIQIEVMELPFALSIDQADLPVATRYLRLPDTVITEVAREMGPRKRPRVGVVWSTGEWNPGRNVPIELLRSLLSDSRFEFWNIQGQPANAQANDMDVCNATQICGNGLLSLAATIANLDLVISADTLAAHLAGALGKPVWLMLQHTADWRWMIDREDSPWYPTMRLFRQPQHGDWHTVVKRIATSLDDSLAESRS